MGEGLPSPIRSGWEIACRRGLGGLFLQIRLPLSGRGGAVHARAMREGALARGDVLRLAAPGLLRSSLQRTSVGEGERPGQAADLVHRVEMRGRLFIRLA